jgi:hypothetical protein
MKLISLPGMLILMAVVVFGQDTTLPDKPGSAGTLVKQVKQNKRCSSIHARSSKPRPPSELVAAQSPPPLNEFFIGEARIEITKDESVVRLAMAQHGSVLIELPANDGPRYIIPGDPELATVDAKALERNKRVIVVRPGSQFLPPLQSQRTHTPAATVTVQMRSGLVVTFLFYPVVDLTQNVHRCVLHYNRDEVIARRRSVGLPVNLEGAAEKGVLRAPNAAALSSITVDDELNESSTVPSKTEPSTERVITLRNLLNDSLNQPTQFTSWTKPVHGLSLSTVSGKNAGGEFIVIAVKNVSPDSLKLIGSPELLLETVNDARQPLHVSSIKPIEVETLEQSGEIAAGQTVYYALLYQEPILGAYQRLKIAVTQLNAADEPATVVLPSRH